MRTLLIAPFFLAIYVAAIFSATWLITEGARPVTPPHNGIPPRSAFTTWMNNMPLTQRKEAPAARERVEELQLF